MTMSQVGAADVEFTRSEVLAKIRTARDAGIISDAYVQTLIELVELLSYHEPQA